MDKLISSLLAILISILPAQSIKSPQTNDNKTTIVFGGDVMLGRSVMGEALDQNDPLYPFRKTADFLKDADVTFVNLENPIVKDCPRHKGGFKFCTTYDIAGGLNYSGVDIVTLANNHTENYGKSGFEETKSYLKENGLEYVGDGNLVIKEVDGVKFGFLGFNYTFSTTGLAKDLGVIKNSDSQVDILIVGNHWGQEYKNIANSFQVNAAHQMIDNGADVVIGHHPHWVQNFEEYNGKPIYYSLGNFVFDQMWSEETKKGLLVKMTFDKTDVVDRQEFRTYIPKIGQPELVN